MAFDMLYYPRNGDYFAPENSMYAQYLLDAPNICRKYHVSADLKSAPTVAAIVLPYLARRKIAHKVVKSQLSLQTQFEGAQAGKFITIYMKADVPHKNGTIIGLGNALMIAHRDGLIQPSPTVPRSRPYLHAFIEAPLDEGCFIYGGGIVDSTV